MSVAIQKEGKLVQISGNLYHKEMFAGMVSLTASTSIPHGWLACDGKEYLQSDYKVLFEMIGTTYNKPETPADKFCVPDLSVGQTVGSVNLKYYIKY